MLALFACLLLAGLLGDIVICKPYKPREGKQRHDSELPPFIRAYAHADHERKNTEADDIAQGVELYPEALFLLASILFRAGDDAVEHIA